METLVTFQPKPDTRRQAICAAKTVQTTPAEVLPFLNGLLRGIADPTDKLQIRVECPSDTTRILTFHGLYDEHKLEMSYDLSVPEDNAIGLFAVTLYWGSPREKVVFLDVRRNSLLCVTGALIHEALFRDRTVTEINDHQKFINAPVFKIHVIVDARNKILHPSPLPGLQVLQTRLASSSV